MANIKSAKKRARQAIKRNERNASQRSTMRTAFKKAVKAVQSGSQETALQAYRTAESALDHYAAKGLIHKNKAARHKSRLMAHIKKIA